MAAPAVTSGLLPALRDGRIVPKRGVERFDANEVHFADGSHEVVDTVVYATGYRISFPFLDEPPLHIRGKTIPLYRRIVPPDVADLYFVGLVDPVGGLLPVIELQAIWIADVLTGALSLPDRQTRWAAAEAGECRTRERFGAAGSFSILCDQWAYRRTLAADQRTQGSPGNTSAKPYPNDTFVNTGAAGSPTVKPRPCTSRRRP